MTSQDVGALGSKQHLRFVAPCRSVSSADEKLRGKALLSIGSTKLDSDDNAGSTNT